MMIKKAKVHKAKVAGICALCINEYDIGEVIAFDSKKEGNQNFHEMCYYHYKET